MSFQNVGTYNAGVFTPKAAGPAPVGGVPVMDADGIASGGAFLVSELEKRDPLIRKPLTSFTYPRDIVIQTGGGWVDYVSAMSVAYGITGGAVNSPVTAAGANGIPVVQASVDKGVYKAHVFAAALRVMFQDMQRANYIGRSLDNLLQDGVRMAYDKHMDANGYVGIGDYGTTGLVNNPDATETTAVNGAKGTAAWATKTPQEILKDVNDAITSVWAANEYDETAVPNHILIPYEQYNYILTTMVTDLATETIYDFLLKNNAAAKNGGSLFIGATRWCKGAGTGDKDRMVVYVNHERFVKMDELVPMSRIMSAPSRERIYRNGRAGGFRRADSKADGDLRGLRCVCPGRAGAAYPGPGLRHPAGRGAQFGAGADPHDCPDHRGVYGRHHRGDAGAGQRGKGHCGGGQERHAWGGGGDQRPV